MYFHFPSVLERFWCAGMKLQIPVLMVVNIGADYLVLLVGWLVGWLIGS